MTVKELIEELKKFPPNTKVCADDGFGSMGDIIKFDYWKSERYVCIYGKESEALK